MWGGGSRAAPGSGLPYWDLWPLEPLSIGGSTGTQRPSPHIQTYCQAHPIEGSSGETFNTHLRVRAENATFNSKRREKAENPVASYPAPAAALSVSFGPLLT